MFLVLQAHWLGLKLAGSFYYFPGVVFDTPHLSVAFAFDVLPIDGLLVDQGHRASRVQ